MIKTSDYPNLNAALDACAQTFGDKGGELHINGVTPLATSATYPCDNLMIRGDGNGSVVQGPRDGDYLTFRRPDGREIRSVTLRDFALPPHPERLQGQGWALHLYRGVRCTIDNVDLGMPETPGLHDNGIWLEGADMVAINNCNVYARSQCVLAHGTDKGSYGSDLFIGGGSKMQNFKRPDLSDYQPGSSIIHLAGGIGGVSIENIDVIFGGTGILIDKSKAAVQNREVFLGSGLWVDSSATDGIRVKAGSVGTLQMTGAWACSSGLANADGCGIRVDASQVPGFEGLITGGRYFNNRQDGIALNGGSWAITGASVTNNKGWGIGFHNNGAGGVVTGCNILRNGQKGVRQVTPGQAITSANRIA